jgi:hypothetical protein
MAQASSVTLCDFYTYSAEVFLGKHRTLAVGKKISKIGGERGLC